MYNIIVIRYIIIYYKEVHSTPINNGCYYIVILSVITYEAIRSPYRRSNFTVFVCVFSIVSSSRTHTRTRHIYILLLSCRFLSTHKHTHIHTYEYMYLYKSWQSHHIRVHHDWRYIMFVYATCPRQFRTHTLSNNNYVLFKHSAHVI